MKTNNRGKDRTDAFRKRMATQAGLGRLDVYVSEEVKIAIRDIAMTEKISAGVAAEALVGLGVRAYLLGKGHWNPAPSVTTTEDPGESTPVPTHDRLTRLTDRPLVDFSARGPGNRESMNGDEQAISAVSKSLATGRT